MGWKYSMHRSDEKCIKNLTGKSERKSPLERHRHKWENDIRMDLSDIKWEVVDWIYLAQDSYQ
jgi:hypothetical protein